MPFLFVRFKLGGDIFIWDLRDSAAGKRGTHITGGAAAAGHVALWEKILGHSYIEFDSQKSFEDFRKFYNIGE